MQNYMVSMDWLSVYTLTTKELTSFIYRDFELRNMAVGTKQFDAMHELLQRGKRIAILTSKPRLKALNPKTCILKLENRVLYNQGAIALLYSIMDMLHLRYKGISRLDLCYDFQRFKNEMKPQTLLRKYALGKIGRNSTEFRRSGRERYNLIAEKKNKGTEFSYMRFGSIKSPVHAYIYNKTKELREVKNKPYIVQNWLIHGLNQETEDVWRAEISIKCDGLDVLNMATGSLFRFSPEDCENQPRLEELYSLYAKKYLNFLIDRGQKYKKDMPSLDLFVCDKNPLLKLFRATEYLDSGRSEKIVANKIVKTINEGTGLSCKEVEALTCASGLFNQLHAIKSQLNEIHAMQNVVFLDYEYDRRERLAELYAYSKSRFDSIMKNYLQR